MPTLTHFSESMTRRGSARLEAIKKPRYRVVCQECPHAWQSENESENANVAAGRANAHATTYGHLTDVVFDIIGVFHDQYPKGRR